jgi:hypothetical protein
MTQPASNDANANRSTSSFGVKLLTTVVVVMGVMIVAGLATVVGRIIYLASVTQKQAPAAAARVPASPVTPAEVRQFDLGLPAGAVIRTMSLSGSRLAVHYEAVTGAGVVLLDTETGMVVSRVRITSTAGEPKAR